MVGAIAATAVFFALTSCAGSSSPEGQDSGTADGSSALDGSAPLGGSSDPISLWDTSTGPHLRGANIWQARVYPELDGTEFKGPGPVGPPFEQQDFDRLASLGANYVNVSHPGLFTEEPPYVLDEDIQENLDDLLDMIEEADMFAVISFRTGPGRSEFSFFVEDESDPEYSGLLNDSVWEDAAAQDAWADMWRYTAERYQNNPIVVGYDLMVEPNAGGIFFDIYEPDEFYPDQAGTLYDWNQFHPNLTTAIREVDTRTPILVGGMGHSAVLWLPFLEPTGDSRTVYMVHQYEPIDYTHQEPPVSLVYPGEMDLDYDGEDDEFNKAWLDGVLSDVDAFVLANDVFVGTNEFGPMRWQLGAAEFMSDQMDLFEDRGMNQAIWSWDPDWAPFSQEVNDFNFQFGPDPENNVRVESSDLITVITENWALNELRPSSFISQEPTPTPDPTPDDAVWGDVDCSGEPDPIDALLTLRFDAGLSADTGDCPEIGQVIDVQNASPHPWGDVDCGGAVNSIDSLKLLRFDAGLSVARAPDCPEINRGVLFT